MQSGIKQIYIPEKAASTLGGICRWWYVPVQWIQSFPLISGKTQQYETEPQLLPGYNWLGPIPVPDAKLGFEESQELAKPGTWYKNKVIGYLPGDSPTNRILRQNMTYGEYVVVAKLRAGEFYIIIGNPQSGLSYDHTFKTGMGGNNSNAGSDVALSGESYYNAPVLASFAPDKLLQVRFAWSTVNRFVNTQTAPVMENVFTGMYALNAPISKLWPQAAQDRFLIWEVPVQFAPKTVYDNGPIAYGQVGDNAIRASFVVGNSRYYMSKSPAGFPFNYLIPLTLT